MTVPKKETQPTEAVVELSPDATPFKNTTTGKTTRTLFQNVVGMVGVIVPVLLASDDFRSFIGHNQKWGWLLIVLPAAGAAITFLQNALEDKVISSQ